MVDINTLQYEAELITESGTRYRLNDALLSLQWGEQKNELAQRLTLTVANMAMGGTWLMSIAKINCIIRITAKWNGGSELCFDGTIWDWQYTSSAQKELTITAYDNLIRLQQSKDFKYYSPGKTTQYIINDVCGQWGIPVSYAWSQSLTHEKKTFSGERISDIIIHLLEEVRQKTGERYIALYKDGKLQIINYGSNKPVYKFDMTNTISTSDKLTINNLVTQVRIIGKQEDDGRYPVDDTIPGDLRYGLLQEIVRRDDDKTLETARAEAKALIKERGKPEETIQVHVPDLPFTRKGDKVEVEAGNLIGFFYVEGVTHNATNRQMTLSLSRGAA
jgi:hypothetical protein